MSPRSIIKACVLSVVFILGVSNASFAQHHGGGHHSGGGHYSGGSVHHGGGAHNHYHGGGYYGGGFGGSGYNNYWGYGAPQYGYGSGFGIGIYSSPQYYSPPQYYAAPQYYSAPTYSTPGYSYPSTVGVTPRAPIAQPVFDNGPIVITSPATNGKSIDYTLNGSRFSIKPGQSQKFTHDRDWIVEFSRGNGMGAGQYTLKATTYKFKQTVKGWELFEAANNQPFIGEPLPPTDEADIGPAPTPEPETTIPAIKAPKPAGAKDAP